MSCSQILRYGSVGVSIEFLIEDCNPDGSTTIVDITSATGLDIIFTQADGVEVLKTGVKYTGGTNGNGTDGIVQYITEVGFVPDTGAKEKWEARAIVSFTDGGIFPSSTVKLTLDV